MSNQRSSRSTAVLAVAAAILLTSSMAAAGQGGCYGEHDVEARFAFALWGDTPYARNGDEATVAAC